MRLVRVRNVQSASNQLPFDTPAPTLADFWRIAELAQRMLPLPEPGFIVVGDSEVAYDGSFERIDGGAYDAAWPGYARNTGSTGHVPLIMDRLVASEARPPDVVYVGVFRNPAGIPVSHAHRGRWLLAAYPGMFLANELAHLHGFPLNANCGNPGPLDPNFPDADNLVRGFPSGSIGWYGLDPVELLAYDPQTTFDLMTACNPRWISTYTFQKVFQALAPLPPDEAPASIVPAPDGEQVVRISFLELHGNWVEVALPNLPRRTPPAPPGPPPPFEFQVLLRDGQGRTLGRFSAAATPGEDGLDPGRRVEADIAWRGDAAALALTAGERTLAEVQIGGAPHLEVQFPTDKATDHKLNQCVSSSEAGVLDHKG